MSDEKENEEKQIGTGYPFAQLVKSMQLTGSTAAKKVQQWQDVIRGMLEGTLKIGSRTPVDGMPAWVTLEVAWGGFATGRYAAGGVLLPHEIEKLATIGGGARTATSVARGALNAYYLSAPGNAELLRMLATGEYRVGVPEEGALMIAAWLDAQGESARAAELRETIMPYFEHLRFYPMPYASAFRSGSGADVYVRTVGETVSKLRSRKPKEAITQMNEALMVWTPLYDRAVSLFLETVEGEVPTLERDGAGELVRQANGQPIAAGGWPCRRYAEDWKPRANRLLLDYESAKNKFPLSTKHAKKDENFARLRGYLQRCVADPKSLTGRDVGAIRKILASYVTAHGAPDSERRQATRRNQQHMAALPLHCMVSQVVANRVMHEAADEGLRDANNFVGPLTEMEAADLGTKAGMALPRAIATRLLACMEAPLRELIEKHIIPSSETVGTTLPILSGRLRVKAVTDRELAALIEQEYRAFRRRRSLLLLNLESQVKFDELPWIAAVGRWAGSDAASRQAAYDALREAAACAFRAFPQTIVPNKLMKEYRGLAAAAGLSIPLVDELAADIFMGQFSANFLRAAQEGGRLLQGSLYERYYAIDYGAVLQLDDLTEKYKTMISEGFANMCRYRAGTPKDSRRSVAYNGTIIEQSQILTTHNLASLFAALDLQDALRESLPDMARRSFKWVCRRLQLRFDDWRLELQALKNSAYAWRQMIFFLSLMPQAEVDSFMQWANEYLNEQSSEFQTRFRPALAGLQSAVAGNGIAADGIRFLGWTQGPHPFRAARQDTKAPA